MSSLVFDIETIGEDFDELDEATQDSLTRWIRKEYADDQDGFNAALAGLKNGLGFSPLTGSVVAIGVLDVSKDKGVVYFQKQKGNEEIFEEDNYTFKPMDEKEMLEHFWEGVEHYSEFVSFNGRAFDIPFLNIRSAIHGIRPSKDLVGARYIYQQKPDSKHIDLLEQLTFYGATHRNKGTLHLYCRAFGIESPKTGGVTGDDVGLLFKEGRSADIARYNSGDLRATKELYLKWNELLRN